MCVRLVNLLLCSLPLHRHSYIGFILAFASSIQNKQTMASSLTNQDFFRFRRAAERGKKKTFEIQRVAGNVSPRSFLFSTFSISLCTWTVQSGFVPHVTSLVQKLLGEMEKCGKSKSPGRHVSCNLLYYYCQCVILSVSTISHS